MPVERLFALVVLVTAVACSDSRGSVGLFGSGTQGGIGASTGEAPADEGSSGDADATTNADAADESTGDDPRFDVGVGATDGPSGCAEGDECGCTAVDILFVIDSSTSMGGYQTGLAAAAPSFTDAIFGALPSGVDLHVGVTTTSFYTGGAGSPGETNCRSTGTVEEFLEYYETPDELDNGENGGQGRLREHEGRTFFATDTAADPAPLQSWLTGNITAVGEHGSVFEMPAAGAAWAFHPANATANAGFVRDEGAVLVLFMLTDEVGNSPESVATYHDMVVAAKSECGGDACIVTGGIMQPCMTSVGDNVEYGLLSAFGEAPVVGDIGPRLDHCYEDCADGDIAVCSANGMSCAESDEWTAAYADALGGTLAQIIADTCAAIPPAG